MGGGGEGWGVGGGGGGERERGREWGEGVWDVRVVGCCEMDRWRVRGSIGVVAPGNSNDRRGCDGWIEFTGGIRDRVDNGNDGIDWA